MRRACPISCPHFSPDLFDALWLLFIGTFTSYCTLRTSLHTIRAKDYNHGGSRKYWQKTLEIVYENKDNRLWFLLREGCGNFEYLLSEKAYFYSKIYAWVSTRNRLNTFKGIAFNFRYFKEHTVYFHLFPFLIISCFRIKSYKIVRSIHWNFIPRRLQFLHARVQVNWENYLLFATLIFLCYYYFISWFIQVQHVQPQNTLAGTSQRNLWLIYIAHQYWMTLFHVFNYLCFTGQFHCRRLQLSWRLSKMFCVAGYHVSHMSGSVCLITYVEHDYFTIYSLQHTLLLKSKTKFPISIFLFHFLQLRPNRHHRKKVKEYNGFLLIETASRTALTIHILSLFNI